MNTTYLAHNFVSQFNKPFDLETISTCIDRDPEEVKPVLVELLTAKQIRLVDPQQGIYVRNYRYSARVSYNQKGAWTYDPLEAEALLDIIASGDYSSVRAIGQVIGRSRQWVFLYMEALASLGCIALADQRYTVVTKDNVREIGKQIVPGILGKMRDEDGKADRIKQAAEKERRRHAYQDWKLERERLRKLKEEEKAWCCARIKAWRAYWTTGKQSYFDLFKKLENQKPGK